ncbi:MAG TPA: M23 family metallopeptidase [Polyangiaceae bacterium]|nr:M23 family metallopeptidase [Polyangiaceae bacterium]
MSSIPPDSSDDEAPSAPSWVAGEEPKRKPRLVASIVDPDVDGLELTGPGAPGSSFGSTEHPVRAKLLARARGDASRSGSSIPIDTTAPWVTPEPPEVVEPVGLPPAPSAAPSAAPVGSPIAEAKPHSARPHEPKPHSARPHGADSVAAPTNPPEPAPSPLEVPLTPPPPPAEVVAELERIAGRVPVDTEQPARLSPNLTALLGCLLGLTVMGTLGVVLGRLHRAAPTAPAEVGLAPAATSIPAPAPVERPLRTKVAGPWRIDDEKGAPGARIVRGTVGKLPFLKAVEEAGVPKAEAYRAYAALKELKNLDRCGPQDQFRALLEQGTKKLKAFEYLVTPEEVYQAKAGDDGLLRGQKLDLKVERNQIRRALVVDGAFDASAQAAGFDSGLGPVIEKALAGHVLLGELKRGDRLRVIVQEVTVLGEFSRYAGVEAIELQREGKPVQRFYYFSSPGQSGYFDNTGRAPFEGGWRKPITTAPVTSHFNMKRMHPVLHKIMPHNGTDFGAPSGTPIGATAPGTVIFMGPAGPSGNLVKLKHAGGYESGYAHLSRWVPGMKVGDTVERMQLVGYVGSTGRSTGPHLHFTIRKDGAYIDAESLNLDGMRVLPPSLREEFAQVRQSYDPVLDAIPLPSPLASAASETATTGGPSTPDANGDELDEADVEDGPAGARPDAAAQAPAAQAPAAQAPATQAPAAAAPASPQPPGTPPTPAEKRPASSIFLTDSELLKMQNARDDGEVRE